jgi:hypothetical protein
MATAFRGLPEAFIDKLAKGLRMRQQASALVAQTAMWERVREALEPLIDRLSDPETRFKETTIEHVRDLITLLPGFNCAGDPRMAGVIEDIKAMIEGVDAKAVRNDTRVRADVVSKARAVTDKLARWGV